MSPLYGILPSASGFMSCNRDLSMSNGSEKNAAQNPAMPAEVSFVANDGVFGSGSLKMDCENCGAGGLRSSQRGGAGRRSGRVAAHTSFAWS